MPNFEQVLNSYTVIFRKLYLLNLYIYIYIYTIYIYPLLCTCCHFTTYIITFNITDLIFCLYIQGIIYNQLLMQNQCSLILSVSWNSTVNFSSLVCDLKSMPLKICCKTQLTLPSNRHVDYCSFSNTKNTKYYY